MSTVWVNPPPLKFSDIFPKRLGIFSPNFTSLLYDPTYAGLQVFIQLPATLTKLCHIKRDHHKVLKMSTIDRNARWVVALNMVWDCVRLKAFVLQEKATVAAVLFIIVSSSVVPNLYAWRTWVFRGHVRHVHPWLVVYTESRAIAAVLWCAA